MSKYNLTDIHEDIIRESMSKGGTVTDSFYSIANNADEIDGQNIGKDTYPIEVKRLGPSSDGKSNEEIIVRYGSDLKDYFSIYDYKFGEDPTSEDNFDEEYSFSLGVPTGKGRETLTWAKKLGFEVDQMMEEEKDRPGYHKDGTPKSDAEMSDDERENFYMDLDSMDEVKAQFDRFK